MTKRILDYSPDTGVTRTFDYIAETDTAVVYSEQNIDFMLELNKAEANDTDLTKQGIKNGMWRYAMIPNIIIEKWLNELGVNAYDKNDEKKVFALLNQPEYKYLKTTSKMHWG